MRDMKCEILKVAMRLLRTGGYEVLNFGIIADELNTTRANIHHHFKNKENLALAAIDRYMDGIENDVSALAEEHPGNFPAIMEALDEELLWLPLSEDDYGGWCVAIKVVADQAWVPEELGRKATQHFEQIVENLTALVEESQRAGTIRSDLPADDVARGSLTIFLGIAQMAMSLPSERANNSFSRRFMRDWLSTVSTVSDHSARLTT